MSDVSGPLYLRSHHCGQLRAADVGTKVRLGVSSKPTLICENKQKAPCSRQGIVNSSEAIAWSSLKANNAPASVSTNISA